jgi:hypothetical protein
MWLSWSRQKKTKEFSKEGKKVFSFHSNLNPRFCVEMNGTIKSFSFWAEGGASKMFMKKVVITDEYFHAH